MSSTTNASSGALTRAHAEHTPGPYSFEKIRDEDGRHFLVKAANGCPIARLDHCAEDEGHARLFAAAPDLLAALQLVARLDFVPRVGTTRAAIETAIAKATGVAP